MKRVQLPDFNDYASLIDMEQVAEAINGPPQEGKFAAAYDPDDFQNIKEMIWSAAVKWLPRDLHDLQIDGIEKEWLSLLGNGLKAYIDIQGIITNPSYDGIVPFAGKRIIADWKSCNGELDQLWRERKLDSWQWRIYSYMTEASLFSYRGISRRAVDGVCPTKEILLAVPESNTDEVQEHIRGLQAQRQALLPFEVWPRNFNRCYDFGRECPFKHDCDQYSMPRFTVPDKVMSFTAFERFQRCPEFSRRMIEMPEADDTEEGGIGAGLHRGMAKLYELALQVKL